MHKTKEQKLLEKQAKKANRQQKTPLQKWTTALMAFSIIAIIYIVTYSMSGIVVLLPTLILWLLWLALVIVGTIATVGVIWTIDGWCNFNSSFIAFNGRFSEMSLNCTQFLYQILPYTTAIFGAIILAFLGLSIAYFVRTKKQGEAKKGKFITSIVFVAVFVIFAIMDFMVYVKFI